MLHLLLFTLSGSEKFLYPYHTPQAYILSLYPRLEFEDVEMGGPEMGACQNDTMMVRKCEGNICNIGIDGEIGNTYN